MPQSGIASSQHHHPAPLLAVRAHRALLGFVRQEGERKRIEAAGGTVSMRRVNGDLAVRARVYTHGYTTTKAGSAGARWPVALTTWTRDA